MRVRPFDPRHLDVEAFAERAGALDGSLPIGSLPRLTESTHQPARPGTPHAVAWRIHGERRKPRGSGMQTWLHLDAGCEVQLTCQRCLQAVGVPLALQRSYRFVADESTAAEADIDAEEDVLVTSRSLDLAALIEDELLLALPLVPRHEGPCPQPLVAPAPVDDGFAEPPARDNPFEALAAFKPRKAAN